MFVNMAQGIYTGFHTAVAAVGTFLTGNATATAAATAAGTPVPAALPANATSAQMATYATAMIPARNAAAAVIPAIPGIPPIPAPLVLMPVDAMNLVLTAYTAEQLAYYGERVWEQPRVIARNVLPGGNAVQHQRWGLDIRPVIAGSVPIPQPIGYWRHIVYAYLLECTNLAEVFQRVVYEWVTGERLPFPTQATQLWLRTTEQLFFTNPQPPSIRSLTSDIRPDRVAMRRNAYYRLLGLDPPAASSDGRAASYVRPDAANREFVRAWEQLMYEAWRAYVNVSTTSGPNPTDINAMQELVREIREMLTARRNGGNLSREEFEAVSFFSWFHLTVLGDTEIVVNLTAQSTSPALRLKKIAERVTVPIHGKADSFFQMADAMADILEAIETGAIDANVPLLYAFALVPGSLTQRMLMVITHWSQTTGRSIKGNDVRALPASQPAAVSLAVPFGIPQASRVQVALR